MSETIKKPFNPPTIQEYIDGFIERRKQAIESDDPEDLYRIVNELDSCDVLKIALAPTAASLHDRIVSTGANACSSANLTDAYARGE